MAEASSHRHLDQLIQTSYLESAGVNGSASGGIHIFYRHCLTCWSTLYSKNVNAVEISVLGQVGKDLLSDSDTRLLDVV